MLSRLPLPLRPRLRLQQQLSRLLALRPLSRDLSTNSRVCCRGPNIEDAVFIAGIL